MKKFLSIFLITLFILSSYAGIVSAQLCDESAGGTNGIVPCGRAMNPLPPAGDGLPVCPCTFSHIGTLALNIFNIIVMLAIPLAGLIVTIAGVLIMISGSMPNLYSKAKSMLWWALIAILLILTSWLIIHTVLWTIGVDPGFIL